MRQIPVGPAPDPRLMAAGGPHLATLRAGGAELFDGPILAFAGRVDEALEGYPASYFAAARSAGALDAEWRAGPGGRPLRGRAIAAAGGAPARDGSGRVALIGIMLAVVLRRRGRRWLVIGRRSPRVASAAGTWATVAGSLEPRASGPPLPAGVATELAEEYPGLARAAPIAGIAASAVVLGGCLSVGRLVPSVCLCVEVATDLPPARLGPLDAGEFSETRLVRLDPAGVDRFWATHGPADLAPPVAATAALLFGHLGLTAPRDR